MPTPEEARRALVLVTSSAVSAATRLLSDRQTARETLLGAAPLIVERFSDGTSALAADHYDDLREEAGAPGTFAAEPVVRLREEKIRTGVLWSTEPLYRPEPDDGLSVERLAQVIQLEAARPFRDTITTNTSRDPASIGWRRETGDGCRFCRMLAGRGAVYKEATARFASHPHCHCTAVPAFEGYDGPEASVVQYVASQRKRTPADRQRVRDFMDRMPD